MYQSLISFLGFLSLEDEWIVFGYWKESKQQAKYPFYIAIYEFHSTMSSSPFVNSLGTQAPQARGACLNVCMRY